MCPQIACLKGCIITQVAFVCLFSRELWSSWRRGGEGRPRPTDWPTSIWVWVERVGPLCPKVCKLLLFHIAQCLLDVSIVSFHLKNKWDPALFSTVHFQMCLQSTCIRGCIIEHKTCDILAAERLRLMRFDNRLIIDSFQEAVCLLKW